uniref:Gamma-soluble NSF attachment protein n=1 Tax=Physcomitrium patens TaxID=3218 RepID=A0A7I4FAB7_PHYPA
MADSLKHSASSSSSALSSQHPRLLQAHDLLRKAEKLTKLSLFNWSSDWVAATPLYEQAATAFKLAKVPDTAKLCYEKAATGQERLSSPWTAGKHMESAGQLAKELGLIDEAVDSYRRASELFLHCGKVQPSADVLSRGQWKMRGRKLQSGCTWMLVRCLRKMVANRWPSIITAQQSISTSSSTGLKTRQQCLLDGASQLINVMPLRASAKHTLVQSLFTYMTKI